MNVAVVVTARNEEHTIGKLLHALAAQTHQPDEIILVDGGSTDDTGAVAQAYREQLPKLRVLIAPGSNISQGRNYGIANSDCTVIAVTDAGCVPAPNWLERIVAPLDREAGLGMVSGLTVPSETNHVQACIGRCTLSFTINIGNILFHPTARNLAFRRDVWEQAAGFPEHLEFGEDAAFIINAVEKGAHLHLESEAVVRWEPRRNYWEVIRQFYNYADGLAQAGLSRTFHLRTLLQSISGIVCAALALLLRHWLPLIPLSVLACAYLWRKAHQGCFDIPSWRTYYRIPAILLVIHLGTMAGMVHGNWVRLMKPR